MAVIDAEEMNKAVLVGHSYAGMVITGVADRLADPRRLQRLIYLDAVLPRPGESWSSGHTGEVQASRRRAIAENGTLPPPDPAVFGLKDADHAWVARRQTPHPGGTYDSSLAFDPARVARWPRSFIDCTSPPLATIDASRTRVRSEPGWDVRTISTGHDAMVSVPEKLLEILLQLA